MINHAKSNVTRMIDMVDALFAEVTQTYSRNWADEILCPMYRCDYINWRNWTDELFLTKKKYFVPLPLSTKIRAIRQISYSFPNKKNSVIIKSK